MADNETTVPPTKLWREGDGHIIVLGCSCGVAVEYPGHPDSRTAVTCDGCGHVWKVAAA